ncbi:MAG TPA: LacI family DNA-binding transcriptional regulator [Armatimonadota bacterium]|jgi:DNA-binding LacI/PurR family transcriptional regulator
MATMRQIAQLANVSTATVSRVLANNPHIRPEVRQRVLDIVQLFRYRSNRLAAETSATPTTRIACIVSSVSSEYYGRVLSGVLEAGAEKLCHIHIVQTHYVLAKACEAIMQIAEQPFDGILFMTGQREPLPHSTLLALWSHNIIPIAIDYQQLAEVDQVLTDEEALGEQLVNYLMRLGHRRIGYLGGTTDREMPLIHFPALTHAMKRSGLGQFVREDYVADFDTFSAEILADPEPPTALIAGDGCAGQFIQHAGRHGIRIPQEISVAGCGNMPFAERLSPPLTTMEQYPEKIGRRAIELLVRRISEGHTGCDYTPETILVPVDLIIRDSCGKPRRTSRIMPKHT